MNALLNLVSNTFDNALYPVMFVDYLHYFPAMRLEGWARWLVSIAMLSVRAELHPAHPKPHPDPDPDPKQVVAVLNLLTRTLTLTPTLTRALAR